jgi:hypothetical protein
MFPNTKLRMGESYSPLYFLAALGAGGLTVTFFMWLLHWVPHPGRPVPIFEDILAAFWQGGLPLQIAIVVAWLGIAFFAIMHVRLLAWNISELLRFRATSAYAALRSSNDETQLLAAPLTVAMSVNVAFILGLVFVPGLWSVVEYLFPLALVAFLAIGVWALAIMRDFWGRILATGGFDCSRNNSFGQLIPAFALSMVGVGLAAPAAMSTQAWIAGVSYIASSFFIVAALIVAAVKLVLGLRAMMENGANPQSAPSLWIIVPIMTVIGIALMRQDHALHAHFAAEGGAAELFSQQTWWLALQIAFALWGLVVLRRFNYFGRFVTGNERSPGAYALVCPGVALAVMVHFYVNKGLVGVGLVEPFGIGFWIVTLIALGLQFVTIWLVITLNRLHFGREAEGRVAAAE